MNPNVTVKYDQAGLVPAVVQDVRTGEILMVAYMNAESLGRTLETGQAWFYSRTRQELWQKGATSGNFLHVRWIRVDCDGDALLLGVEPQGPACHTGERSCFFRTLKDGFPSLSEEGAAVAAGPAILEEIFRVIQERARARPEGSYTSKLLEEGLDKIAKKIGEEAAEVIIAAKNGEVSRIAAEIADLWFHTLVLLAASGMEPGQVWEELQRRRR